jgi:hypothetical protein
VRPADAWVSVRTQAGNADDVLMARVHGRDWRAARERRAGGGLGTWRVTAGVAAAALALAGARRTAGAAALPGSPARPELAWPASARARAPATSVQDARGRAP